MDRAKAVTALETIYQNNVLKFSDGKLGKNFCSVLNCLIRPCFGIEDFKIVGFYVPYVQTYELSELTKNLGYVVLIKNETKYDKCIFILIILNQLLLRCCEWNVTRWRSRQKHCAGKQSPILKYQSKILFSHFATRARFADMSRPSLFWRIIYF